MWIETGLESGHLNSELGRKKNSHTVILYPYRNLEYVGPLPTITHDTIGEAPGLKQPPDVPGQRNGRKKSSEQDGHVRLRDLGSDERVTFGHTQTKKLRLHQRKRRKKRTQ